MKTFQYQPSLQIIHWGVSFDSLLELKYAIFISDEYEFMRAQIPIFFNPKTQQPVPEIRKNYLRYTPDFLIRHKINKQAFLVELKPRAFADQDQLKLRRHIAERYIRWKRWDWTFITVFDDEVILNEMQLRQVNECCKIINGKENKNSFDELPPFFNKAPSGKQVHFVMYGE